MTKFPKKIYKLVPLLILVVLVLAGCSDSLTPFDVASQYLQNEANANFISNYDLLSSDSQLKIGRNEYAARLNQARQDAGIVSISNIVPEKNPTTIGNRASVPYHVDVTLQNGQKTTLFEALVMLHQDNGWRIVWPPQ